MIVFDKNKLENSVLIEEADSLKNAGFISKEQLIILAEGLKKSGYGEYLMRIIQ